jgi:hypothetical protein
MPHSAKSTTKKYSLSSNSSIIHSSSKLDQGVVHQSYITKNNNVLSLVTNLN